LNQSKVGLRDFFQKAQESLEYGRKTLQAGSGAPVFFVDTSVFDPTFVGWQPLWQPAMVGPLAAVRFHGRASIHDFR
jgi:hypothetical protein